LAGMQWATDPSTRLTREEVLAANKLVDSSGRPDDSHLKSLLDEAETKCRDTLVFNSLFKSLRSGELNLNTLRGYAKYQNWVLKNSLNGFTAASAFTPVKASVSVAPKMASPSMPFMLYHVVEDQALPFVALDAFVRTNWLEFKTQPKTAWGYTDVARTNKVWLPVNDSIGQHALGEVFLYNTDFSSYRYTPDEWLFDTVYGRSRAEGTDYR
jgi:hypothetical protein